MNIFVLLAGVHDPKWPIVPEAAATGAADTNIMSPFDEAALEIALRLRDAEPATAIAVRVAGGHASDRIARAVLALNVADVATVAITYPWDQAATARTLASLCNAADLVLIGREFGDFDDGLVPATLAGLLGFPFFGRAQTISTTGGVRLMREAASHEESLTLAGPLVASVTNDRRTRLRKPLMKNVMEARQAAIGRIEAASTVMQGLSLDSLRAADYTRRNRSCDILDGPLEQQAEALADLIWEARA